MNKYIFIIFSCFIILQCSKENVYSDVPIISDTLYTINSDTIYIKISRRVNYDKFIKSESIIEFGDKYFIYYTDNIINILYLKNSKIILKKIFTEMILKKYADLILSQTKYCIIFTIKNLIKIIIHKNFMFLYYNRIQMLDVNQY